MTVHIQTAAAEASRLKYSLNDCAIKAVRVGDV